MIGIYFSGTGNTKYCINRFLSFYGEKKNAYALEDRSCLKEIREHQNIIFAYPVYYSNLPKIVRDFIEENDVWKGKRIFIIATMGLFSGDGAGLAARLLKKKGAAIVGGLHVKMPDCICDVKALKRTYEKNQEIVCQADRKLRMATDRIKGQRPPKEGLGGLSHLAGLLGQRLWFYNKTKEYSDKLKINIDRCSGCGKCTLLCPMDNLTLSEGKAKAGKRCTMCYRCISQCPQQAITLLGHQIEAKSFW